MMPVKGSGFGKKGMQTMRKVISYALGVVFISLTLAACGFDGKYENDGMFGLFDNNCSGNGGYFDAKRCADYVNAG
jgi:hypothetical protein